MPLITRWYIRSSFLYLIASLLAGLLIALRSALNLPAVFGVMGPVYLHLFLVGWVTQLIFGVIFWLFPKPQTEIPYWERVGWIVWGLLNTGLLLRVVAEPPAVMQPRGVWGWMLVASAVLQWLAGIGLIAIVWPRAYTRDRRRR
ncbi:MAG: hypothetical protein ACOC9E_01330 [Chloroflexota bacterium]